MATRPLLSSGMEESQYESEIDTFVADRACLLGAAGTDFRAGSCDDPTCPGGRCIITNALNPRINLK